jgi:hypothetical protein
LRFGSIRRVLLQYDELFWEDLCEHEIDETGRNRQSSDRKIRHLAVLEKQKVIGIASIGVGCDVDHIRSGGGN